ncbi:hypothetical protein BDV93DRAFT_521536 [Ceratobasidium sp. AG-I]|nr:hypothetical protein BDV93DRAFT_521536 [Ceratobasidium sp. AG-I]
MESQNNLALTDSEIEALPIVFDLPLNEGGNLYENDFRHIKGALLDTGSLKHLPFAPDILQKEGTICHTIIAETDKPAPMHRRLDWTREEHYWCLTMWFDGKLRYMAGLCFLFFPSPADRTVAQIGVALLPESRGKGFGRAAVHKLLRYAFEALKVHRVVAHITCPSSSKETSSERKQAIFQTRQLCWTFEKFGFQFEGISRGSMSHPKDDVWQDEYRLSILDIDWFTMQPDSGLALPTRAVSYEGMVQRHEAEVEEMQQWLDVPANSSTYKGKGGTAVGHDSDDDGEYYGAQDSDECMDDSDDDSGAETI